MATKYYVSHAEPNKEPIVFSETTRTNVKRVHNISGKAVKVTSATTALIHTAVEKLADRVAGRDNAPSSHTKGATSPYLSRSPGGGASPATSFSNIPQHGGPPPPLPPRKKPGLLNRLLTSTDLLLTTVESSAYHLISHGTNSLSTALGHKYGKDMEDSVKHVGESVRNVGVVYVDARGVGRRALLKTAGKRIVFGDKKGHQQEVVFGGDGSTTLAGFVPNANSAGPSRAQTMPPGYSGPSGNMPGAYTTSKH